MLHLGGNDCSDSVDVKAILGQYNELIDLAATAVSDTGTVRVSSVCARSNPETKARIDTFNSGLSELCQSRNILNASGTAVLSKNLDINIQFKKRHF